MRTSHVYSMLLTASLLVFSGCAMDGDAAAYRNGSRLTYGQETAERSGGDYGNGRRFGLFGWNRRDGNQGYGDQGYGDPSCGSEGCATGVADGSGNGSSQYCSTANGAPAEDGSGYQFDCGPMCGAYLSDEQCQNKMVSDNYKRGNSYVRSQINGMLPNNGERLPFNGNRGAVRNGDPRAAAFRRGMPAGRFAPRGRFAGRNMGECEDCVSADTALMGTPQVVTPQMMNPQMMDPQTMTPATVTQQATCKGLAGTVGCQGCQDCAPNQAMAGQVAPSGPMANTREDQQNPWNKGILAGLFSRNENKRDAEQYGYPQDGGPVGPQWAPGPGYSQTPDQAVDSEGNPQQKPKGVGIFSGFFTKATADQPVLQSDPNMGQPIDGAGFWDQSAPVMQGGPVNNPMMTNGSAEFSNYSNGVSDAAMCSDGSCSDPVYADGNFGPGMSDCGCGARGGMGCRCGKGLCGCGRLGCNGGCRARRHPYGGELPHTAADSMTGTPNSAPTYAYPYYTTRGPRDFLADGCAPPQIYPYNPQPLCLPTIGR